MKLSILKSNPNNPRIIKDDKFKKLVKSISEFPKMLELRPIIVDENFIVQGGNMRLKALQELKYKDIPDEWVKQVSDLSEDQKKEFIIKDNVGYGEWDYDDLANNWDVEKLVDWGLDLPIFENNDIFETTLNGIGNTEYPCTFVVEMILDYKEKDIYDFLHEQEKNGFIKLIKK